jgi:hypothetical protein
MIVYRDSHHLTATSAASLSAEIERRLVEAGVLTARTPEASAAP